MWMHSRCSVIQICSVNTIPYPSKRTVLRPAAVAEVGETGGFLVDADFTGCRFVAVVGLTGRWFAAVVGLTRRLFVTVRCGSEGSTMTACWESAGSGSGRGGGAAGGAVVDPCFPASLFKTGISSSGSAVAGESTTVSLRDDGRGSVGARAVE